MPNNQSQLVLVFGGARSGKSAASEEMATQAASSLQASVTYIATAEARDVEMAQRAASHRSRRPQEWHTIEEPYEVGKALESIGAGVFLIDCLTLYISNWLLRMESEGLSGKDLEDAVLTKVDALIQAAQACHGSVIVVSNEVGLGVVPAYPLGRLFRDIAGKANQKLAAAADEVIYCLAGLRLPLKHTERRTGQDSTQPGVTPPVTDTKKGKLPQVSPADAPPAPFYEAPGLALQFLTRLPGPTKYLAPEARLVESMRWFPAIGGLIGLIGGLICALSAQVFTPEITAALIIAALVMITGNLHFDGLMDTADGVYGGYTADRRLEIMHDSRMGAHGVAAGILVTLVKWSALTVLVGNGDAIWLLPLVIAASRWSLVFAALMQPPARQDGFARLYANNLRLGHLLGATVVWCSVVLLVYAAAGVGSSLFAMSGATISGVAYAALLSLASSAIVAWLLGRYLRGKLGGLTGDTLGATNELAEVAVLLLFAAIAN